MPRARMLSISIGFKSELTFPTMFPPFVLLHVQRPVVNDIKCVNLGTRDLDRGGISRLVSHPCQVGDPAQPDTGGKQIDRARPACSVHCSLHNANACVLLHVFLCSLMNASMYLGLPDCIQWPERSPRCWQPVYSHHCTIGMFRLLASEQLHWQLVQFDNDIDG
jgi:hypothetical protein